MSTVLSLLGSPSLRSRSGALLGQLEDRLAAALGGRHAVARLALRELPAAALLRGDATEPAVAGAIAAVAEAELLLVATPIYKAAYSGLLKAFLDLLPQDALRGKTVVPLATGGSAAHLLALDYALKPVLGALGARDIRDAIYATDAQLPAEGGGHVPVTELRQRLDRVAAELLRPHPAPRWLQGGVADGAGVGGDAEAAAREADAAGIPIAARRRGTVGPDVTAAQGRGTTGLEPAAQAAASATAPLASREPLASHEPLPLTPLPDAPRLAALHDARPLVAARCPG